MQGVHVVCATTHLLKKHLYIPAKLSYHIKMQIQIASPP